MNKRELSKKVQATINKLIREKGYVSSVDLFIGLDKLSKEKYEDWRKKKIPYLERVIYGNLNQFSFIMKELRTYCIKRGMKPSKTIYNSWGKGPKVRLQFSKSDNKQIEESYATHYVSKKKIDEP
jgi:hypothetical protein